MPKGASFDEAVFGLEIEAFGICIGSIMSTFKFLGIPIKKLNSNEEYFPDMWNIGVDVSIDK